MSTPDHHTAYLARAVALLTPQGRERVDELLDQLADAAGNRAELTRFAAARKAEADLGRTDTGPRGTLTKLELDELAAGFMTIRDQEPLDDVADWANAVLALIEDEVARPSPDGKTSPIVRPGTARSVPGLEDRPEGSGAEVGRVGSVDEDAVDHVDAQEEDGQ